MNDVKARVKVELLNPDYLKEKWTQPLQKVHERTIQPRAVHLTGKQLLLGIVVCIGGGLAIWAFVASVFAL